MLYSILSFTVIKVKMIVSRARYTHSVFIFFNGNNVL